MNNNNRNNRRRGRGNRNQGGGGQQLNRIDSRARGNAPQLLEKYKKLAQDAQHNGDRVQAEYYLQFADHYFRVIADNKSRQDEARGGRRPDDRSQSQDDDYWDDEGDDRRNLRRPRDDRDEQDGDDRGNLISEGEQGFEGEPVEFSDSGDERSQRRRGGGDRPRRRERPDRGERSERNDSRPAEIDAAVLPPSIGSGAEESGEAVRKPRRRRSKDEEQDGDALRAVG